jgi:glycosyltransferase involved in cell wall biosynthesis
VLTPFLNGVPYHHICSGYERLIHFVDVKRVYHSVTYRQLNKLSYPLRMAKLIPWFYTSLEAERQALSGDFLVLHHLYGEDTYLLSWRRRFRKSKSTVVTFHQPPNRFIGCMPVYWRALLESIDGIIVLSPTQFEFLRREGYGDKLFLVPHGVDVGYFVPSQRKSQDDVVALSIGSHLRDYPTLIKAFETVGKEVPGLRLVVVSNKLRDAGTRNVIVKRSVPDAEIMRLYASASFVVLPATDATASNVLLEAMACGLPVIATSLKDIHFYCEGKGVLYYERGDVDALCDRMRQLIDSVDLRQKLGAESRQRAESLSWSFVAKQTAAIYEKCCFEA